MPGMFGPAWDVVSCVWSRSRVEQDRDRDRGQDLTTCKAKNVTVL